MAPSAGAAGAAGAAGGGGDCAGRLGLLAVAAGAAAGAAVALAGDTAASPGQLVISVAVAAFLALSNYVPGDSNSGSVLAGACGCVGFFLGWGAGRAAAAGGPDRWDSLPLPLFLVLVMLFHAAEFAFVVFFHTKDINFRALMLSPVPAGGYSIALIAALVEYWLESPLLGAWWLPSGVRATLCIVGFGIGLLGWGIRTLALFTAQSNFTHIVAYRKDPNHVLVTAGIYRLCRHPGYLGWFMWSVSTQIALGNPLCFMAYTYVSWKFFAGRIPGEEDLLVDFFGDEYLAYAQRVPCGLPWISRL